jgi:uncharacterized protein (DUF433 family)
MDWKPYIVVDPKILNGQAHIKNTKITVQQILEELASGMTTGNIVKNHPVLDKAAILAALIYGAELAKGSDTES